MNILLPVCVAVVGLLLWALDLRLGSPPPAGARAGRLAEVGRILFAIGAFFTVWAFAGDSLRLVHR